MTDILHVLMSSVQLYRHGFDVDTGSVSSMHSNLLRSKCSCKLYRYTSTGRVSVCFREGCLSRSMHRSKPVPVHWRWRDKKWGRFSYSFIYSFSQQLHRWSTLNVYIYNKYDIEIYKVPAMACFVWVVIEMCRHTQKSEYSCLKVLVVTALM